MGTYKYALYLPFVAVLALGLDDADQWCAHMLAIAALRYVQAWVWNLLSRNHSISGHTRIQGKGVDFKQIDREDNWDDYIILQARARPCSKPQTPSRSLRNALHLSSNSPLPSHPIGLRAPTALPGSPIGATNAAPVRAPTAVRCDGGARDALPLLLERRMPRVPRLPARRRQGLFCVPAPEFLRPAVHTCGGPRQCGPCGSAACMAPRGSRGGCGRVCDAPSRQPPSPSCTAWTRLVLLPVLTGHVSTFSPY